MFRIRVCSGVIGKFGAQLRERGRVSEEVVDDGAEEDGGRVGAGCDVGSRPSGDGPGGCGRIAGFDFKKAGEEVFVVFGLGVLITGRG